MRGECLQECGPRHTAAGRLCTSRAGVHTHKLTSVFSPLTTAVRCVGASLALISPSPHLHTGCLATMPKSTLCNMAQYQPPGAANDHQVFGFLSAQVVIVRSRDHNQIGAHSTPPHGHTTPIRTRKYSLHKENLKQQELVKVVIKRAAYHGTMVLGDFNSASGSLDLSPCVWIPFYFLWSLSCVFL